MQSAGPTWQFLVQQRGWKSIPFHTPFWHGITLRLGDANDPGLPGALGLQDIVVAKRFLCHMDPNEAEFCLGNLARLVKGGGYLFVSGVDLDVRSKVAREFGWRPVTELIPEIHEGDPSLRRDWPLQYWAWSRSPKAETIGKSGMLRFSRWRSTRYRRCPLERTINGEFNRKSAGHKSKWSHIALLHRISDGNGPIKVL